MPRPAKSTTARSVPGDPDQLIQRGDARLKEAPPVLTHDDQAIAQGRLAQLGLGGVAVDQRPNFVVDDQGFMDTRAALIA